MTDLEISSYATYNEILDKKGAEKSNNQALCITTECKKDKHGLRKHSLNISNSSLKQKPSLKRAATQWLLYSSPRNTVPQTTSSQEKSARIKPTRHSFIKQRQSSQYQLDLKSEDYEKRPLNARRMAICDEIERRVIISGESLRVLRKNIIVYDNLHKWNLL